MSTLNGIGSKLYGKEYIKNSGKYFSTEWFVFAFLPIYPISSYIVHDAKDTSGFYTSKEYKLQEVGFYKKQIYSVYFWEVFCLSLIFLLTQIYILFGIVFLWSLLPLWLFIKEKKRMKLIIEKFDDIEKIKDEI